MKELREAKGMTIYDLADKVGWSYETISAIERGDRKINLDHLEGICPALGVEPAELFSEGEGEGFTKLEQDVIAALRLGGPVAAMKVLVPALERDQRGRSS